MCAWSDWNVLQKTETQCEEAEPTNEHTSVAETEPVCRSFETQGNSYITPEQAQTSRVACQEARGRYLFSFTYVWLRVMAYVHM